MSEQMENYKMEMISRCNQGINGKEKIKVTEVNMWLTNKCNCSCLWCPYVLREYEKHTYNNEEPFMMSLCDLKKIFPRRIFRRKQENVNFMFFTGETLLNPELFKILRYLKRVYPKSKINILSNATIPPKDSKIIKYIDVLGFSIDAGTKDIYEKIRIPAQFGHVEKVLAEWVKARNEYNPKCLLRTSTTLSTLNIYDLPNIVEFIGRIITKEGGRWDSIYCQPLVIENYQDLELKKLTLDHADVKLGQDSIKKAYIVAKKYGIRFDMPESILKMFNVSLLSKDECENKEIDEDNNISVAYKNTFCKKLENGILSYDKDGNIGYACCFMDKKYGRKMIIDYGIPDTGSLDDIYNSKGYWQMRKDLLEGELTYACRDCQIGMHDYYKIKRELEEKIFIK